MRLSLWDSGRHGKNFTFIDRHISEFFGVSGTAVLVHLYIGPYLQPNPTITADGTVVNAFSSTDPTDTTGSVNTIEDPLLGENRDRQYSTTPIEMRCIYNLNDLDFDLKQFGLFLGNDTHYIEFHLLDMIEQCGRKIMPGDVLELPHRRDTGLDPADQVAINKFYLVEDAARASDGYSVTWWPHVWRVKVSPMPASQEFADILNSPATDPLGLPINGLGSDPVTIGSIMTTTGADLALNEAIDAEAKLSVPARYFETQHYWIKLPENPNENPWIFAGDGIPPNGGTLLGSGSVFPPAPNKGEYYLRTDYKPETLFMWTDAIWQIQEKNYRPNWMAASNMMLDFINNNTITVNQDGTTAPEKVNLSRTVLPKADF